MKKVLTFIIFIFLALVFIGCASPPTDSMTQLDTPIQVDCSSNINEEIYWVTHSYVMNEDQTLYYAPSSVRFDGNVYINDTSGFFIFDESQIPNWISGSCTVPDTDTIHEILRE